MENSINIWAVILLLIAGFMLSEVRVVVVKKIKLYFNPPKPFAWVEEYANLQIKYPHPIYKGLEGVGKIVGIDFTKERGKGGVPKFKLRVDEGAGSITPIWMDSKWEKVSNAKNKQQNP